MSIFYQLPVKEVRRETSEAVSILFDVPDELKEDFRYLPGQYLTIQADLDGSKIRRAYSICSSPDSGEWRVAVKAVEKGRFSNFANKKLKAGDKLDVSAPEGRFILKTDPGHNRNYIAFAAGSGITPVISMVKAVLNEEEKSEFVLVYSNKSKERTIFWEELESLRLKYPGRFHLHLVYSQILSDKAFFGRIDTSLVRKLLSGPYAGKEFDAYFICGPEDMIDTVRGYLLNHEVGEDLIHYELFSSTSHKKEVKKDLSGNANITVVLDDEETTFEMRMDEFILDAAINKGLDAPYSCQGGICSSCLAKVVEGKAVMEKNTILDQDEVEEGLILTCQAHPVTSSIKIDYDDV